MTGIGIIVAAWIIAPAIEELAKAIASLRSPPTTDRSETP